MIDPLPGARGKLERMKRLLLATLALTTVLVSCVTVNRDIPDGAATEIYFQRAQAETDLNHFETAQAIFEQFLRQADGSVEEKLSARFEIALLKAKQGDSTGAIKDFRAILGDFQDVTQSAKYPAWIKVLSEKKLLDLQGSPPPKT